MSTTGRTCGKSPSSTRGGHGATSSSAVVASRSGSWPVTDRGVGDPRNNPDDAYEAFMSMGSDEWKGLFRSLTSGGVLTSAEQVGYDRAIKERGLS